MNPRNNHELRPHPHRALAAKLTPHIHGFPTRMTAVIGAILNYDYGVREPDGGKLTYIHITKSGDVVSLCTGCTQPLVYIGPVQTLEQDIRTLTKRAKLTQTEIEEFERVYRLRVKDWRTK